MFTFSFMYRIWDGQGICNPSLWILVSCITNTSVADCLAEQGSRASSTTVMPSYDQTNSIAKAAKLTFGQYHMKHRGITVLLVTVDIISCEYLWGADIGVIFACPRQRVMGIVLSQSNGSMTGIYIYWKYLTDYISERRDEWAQIDWNLVNHKNCHNEGL